MPEATSTEQAYVLVFSPTANDSRVACETLHDFEINAYPCYDIEDLLKAEDLCLAVVISEEALTPSGVERLQFSLSRQAAWSDLPVIILTGNSVQKVDELFTSATNVSLLERPFSRLTFVRSVQAALRSRRKQFEVRDLLLALQKAKAEAERANAAKTQFLANMSHEIRTPIGAIMGFVDLLKSPDNSTEEKNNYIEIIDRNSQQLLRLIDDLLDLSKVEAGKMIIEHLPFSLPDLLADFGAMMEFKASEKRIQFKTLIEGLIPDQIVTDPVRLRQILSNIVGNAIKFTASGTVEMKVTYSERTLSFLISDTGIGLSAKQAARLFQPFVQADTSTSRKFGGTGLGLVLARSLAKALGGDLKLVQSSAGEGSVFLVDVTPELAIDTKMVGAAAITIDSTSVQTRSDRKILRGLHVLLVDDSSDNQMLIKTYLKKHGATVETAADGLEGFTKARNKNFDVVLMDVQMPNMDGHEATRKLRAQSYDRPVIALTAHAMQEERLKCFESGFTDFLTKPIELNRLIEVLSRYRTR